MSIQTQACPLCEEGVLTPIQFEDAFSHEGRTVTVRGLEGNRCAACAAEPIFPEQIRRNQLRISDAKREALGLLKADQIRAIREVLGLSQQDAAVIFGGGTNGFSKYERGQTIQSVPMDRLLRSARTFPFMLEFLRIHAGMPPTVASGEYESVHAVSLNDPLYTSKPVHGLVVVASESEESSVLSFSARRTRKVA